MFYDKNGNKITVPLTYNPMFSYPPIGYDIKAPLAEITKNIAGSGPANILSDNDGKRRKMPLLYRIYDERIMAKPIFMPTIGLIMAMGYFNVKSKDVVVELGKAITLKGAMIRKPIKYVRKSINDSLKVYRWNEYVDEFMEHIIKNIITIVKKKNKTNNFKINYMELLDNLLSDKELKTILKNKYKKNNLNIDLSYDVLKREINDFLISLTQTSISKYLNFFQIESKKIDNIDLDKLNDYLSKLRDRNLVLSSFIQRKMLEKDDLKRKVKITFIDKKDGKISFKNFKAPKDQYYTLVTGLITNNPINEEEFFRVIIELSNNNLIKLANNGGFPGIKSINRKAIDEYYKSIPEQSTKDIIKFITTYDDIKIVLGKLKKEGLVQYYEKKGEFITFTNLKQMMVLKQSLKDKEQIKIIDYIFNFSDPNENQFTRVLDELYSGMSDLKINKKSIKKTLNLLLENNLISYPTFSYINIQDLNKLIEYKDNPHKTKNLAYRKIITKLIDGLDYKYTSFQENSKFYTIKTNDAISYLVEKTKINKDKVLSILKNAYAKIDHGRQNNVIRVIDQEIQIFNPKGILNGIDEIKIYQEVVSRLISLAKKDKALYYNNTLINIAREAKINPLFVEQAIDNITADEKGTYKINFIKKEDRLISGDIEHLETYRISNDDIRIPIDEVGQMIINYQGYHRSFENDHFGKYMGLSRERYINNEIPPPYGIGYEKETPSFSWERFKNKIIFIGFYTTAGLGESRDYFETPYGTLFGIEIHANALNTIIKRDFITPLSKNILSIGGIELSYEYTIMFLFALLFGTALPRLTILRGFLFFFTITFFYILFNFLYIFPKLKIDIPLVGTILTMLFSFITLMVYKLMTEEKDKRKIKGMFSKYVSAEVVDSILESNKKLELGGESRVLTVLFSDIRGFTSFSENLNPHELVDHLNIYLSEMSDIVIRYKGTLDKYIGDALMAFWGAPLDIEDHALLACKTALKMNERLEELNKGWPDNFKIRIGIGLNTGDMIVGNMGSTQRMDYTIMGDQVNLGSRVEGANKVYGTELIITEHTYKLVKDYTIVRELDIVRVKGKVKPVKIYELLAIK